MVRKLNQLEAEEAELEASRAAQETVEEGGEN